MRPILSLLVLLLLTCCSSTSVHVAAGTPVEVHFYSQEQHLLIVNDSALAGQGVEGENAAERRQSFASDPESDPFSKVISDDEMTGLLEALDRVGMNGALRRPGPAPRGGDFGMALEIRQGSSRSHAVSFAGMTGEQKVQLLDCVQVFQAVYNVVQQYQAVPEDMGKDMIEDARRAGAGQ